MADLTGTYPGSSLVISQNTESVLRHRARFVSGATGSPYIALPLAAGKRYIIYSAITAGTFIKIGLSTDGSTIIDEASTLFSFAHVAAPLDLSNFFATTPFTTYIPPSDTNVYLLILSDAAVAASIVEYKA